MKVKETRAKDQDYRQYFRLEVEGGGGISISDHLQECSEDAILGRDLNFVYGISELMRLAYEAGKRGDTFDVEKVTVSAEEFNS